MRLFFLKKITRHVRIATAYTAGSSSGRTSVSGTESPGSNPGPAASNTPARGGISVLQAVYCGLAFGEVCFWCNVVQPQKACCFDRFLDVYIDFDWFCDFIHQVNHFSVV
jgi:hypothetical protein